MHIAEGVLSAPVLIGDGALTAVGTAIGLKRIDYDRIAPVAILTSAQEKKTSSGNFPSLIHLN